MMAKERESEESERDGVAERERRGE